MHACLATAHRLSGDSEQADRALDRMAELVARLPSGEELPSDEAAGYRMAPQLAQGTAGPARELLERVAPVWFADHRADGLAWGAELLGGLLALEGEPVGAATALGMSEATRGAFDRGDPELGALSASFTERLGAAGCQAAFAR